MSAPRPSSEGAPGAALIAAAAAGAAALDGRLAAADAEIAWTGARRIDEETRARAALIVAAVVREVAGLLRAAEPMLDAGADDGLPARMAAAGLVARSRLGAAALARAEQHRLAAALARAVDGDDPGGDHDTIAGGRHPAEAFALREAESAQIDAAGDPLLPLHDIAPEQRHALFWHVAACLAAHALAALGSARAGGEDAVHRAAAAAVGRALAAIDDGDGIAPAALRLAHALEDAGGLDDARLAGALAAGRVATLAGLLAVRAGIGFEAAAAMIADPARATLLLRACDVARPVAAAMVLTLALAAHRDGDGDAGVAAAGLLDAFDALPVDMARAEVRRSRLEPAYREALKAIAPTAGATA